MTAQRLFLTAWLLAAAAPSPGASAGGNLGSEAAEAVRRLQARQNPAGYWLTSYTPSERFQNPHWEMNTFLTSVMVDILEPVAAAAGLEENLARARRHLSNQIEANGLVRYHGRPDSPTIPSLGCVITPDADDTALVWRIAGRGKDARLPGVIAILRSYRTSEGLYRTWLAPWHRYVNIDPGEDPNPADVGIQMHLLMFLDAFDRPAAGELYRSLRRALGEDRIWVYYERAPLLPLLRLGDLRRLGYALVVPPGRLQTALPEQAAWVRACRLLDPPPADETPVSSVEAAVRLRALAAGDFAEIRRHPPLLYHNDLTAAVRRFYWSEDFGYALWLRLRLENIKDSARSSLR